MQTIPIEDIHREDQVGVRQQVCTRANKYRRLLEMLLNAITDVYLFQSKALTSCLSDVESDGSSLLFSKHVRELVGQRLWQHLPNYSPRI